VLVSFIKSSDLEGYIKQWFGVFAVRWKWLGERVLLICTPPEIGGVQIWILLSFSGLSLTARGGGEGRR